MAMPPLQPYGNTPAGPNPDNYDFIVNYGKHRHPNQLFSINNSSLKTRLMVAGAGGIFLIIIIWILVALITSSGGTATTPLVSITQQQNEMARVSLAASQVATEQPTQNFAITTELSLLTEQQAFINFLHGLGSSPSSSVLQATRNSGTDSTLLTAKNNGTYDQTYLTIAKSELTTYEHSLQQAYPKTSSMTERQLLSTAYNQAQLLLQQSNQTE
jgi:hypothetical protein